MKIPVNYKSLSFYQLQDKLNSNYWSNLNDYEKELIMLSLFDYEKNNLKINSDISFEITSLQNLAGGFYSRQNKICIDKNLLYKSEGYSVFSIIKHELFHAKQNQLICEKANVSNIMNIYSLYQNGTDNYFHFLNFNDSGNFHIQFMPYSFENISLLSRIYYYLNVYEREAYMYAYSYLDEQNISYNSNIDMSIYYFNEYYTRTLAKEQVCELIDNCFYMISQNIEPETDLEASVMYDICCLALLENNKISELECKSMLEDNYKKGQLAEYGYCLNEEDRYGKYIITNSLREKVKEYAENKKEFAKLTPFQQRDNPYIVLRAIMHFQDEIKDYILKENLDYLFVYAARNKEYLYPIVQEKLLEWYPDKYHEYLDEEEIEL